MVLNGARDKFNLNYRVWVWLSEIASSIGRRFKSHTNRVPNSAPRLAIEAGARGWGSLEYVELLRSAKEYVGAQNVVQLVHENHGGGRSALLDLLRDHKITHFFYDPRTGKQKYLAPWFRMLRLKLVLSRLGITPIALATDFSYRAHRHRALILAHKNGAVATFLDPAALPIQLHVDFVVGPLPLSVSVATSRLRASRHLSFVAPLKILFFGSLYEPRRALLEEVDLAIWESLGFRIKFLVRELGGKRRSDDEYWEAMESADIVLNTTCQNIKNKRLDWREADQMNYRVMEATMSGALLLSQSAPGMENFFNAGKHYLEFGSPQDALQKIHWVLDNPREANRIAGSGQRRAKDLAQNHTFWEALNEKLAASQKLRYGTPEAFDENDMDPVEDPK